MNKRLIYEKKIEKLEETIKQIKEQRDQIVAPYNLKLDQAYEQLNTVLKPALENAIVKETIKKIIYINDTLTVEDDAYVIVKGNVDSITLIQRGFRTRKSEQDYDIVIKYHTPKSTRENVINIYAGNGPNVSLHIEKIKGLLL